MSEKVIIDIDIDNDGAIQATKDLTSSIVDQTDAIKKTNDEIKALEKANKDITKTNKELNDQITKGTLDRDEGNKRIEANTKAIETNNAKIKQNKVEVIGQKDALSKTNSERKQAVKTMESESNSIDSLRSENSKLTKERNSVNLATAEGQKRVKEINKELDKNNATIKENSDEYLKQKINIGNYEESIKNALGPLKEMFPAVGKITDAIGRATIGFKRSKDENKGFTSSIKGTTDELTKTRIGFKQSEESVKTFNTTTGNSSKNLGETKKGLKGAAEGTKGFISGIWGMIKASLTFIATPVGLILAAIAVVLAVVTNALSKMQPVMDKINQVTAGLGASLNSLFGVLQSVGSFIKEVFINTFLRLEAGILKARIAINNFAGNSEKVIELEKELAGVNKDLEESNKAVAESLDGVAESVTGVSDAFKKGAAGALALQQAEDIEIANITTNAALRKQADLLTSIADDATKSFAVRKDAAEGLAKVEETILENDLKVQKIREGVLAKEIERKGKLGQSSRELNRQLAEATATRIQTETSLQNFQRGNEKRLSELKNDELERDLDFEIDIIDKRLQAVRGQAGQEFLSLDERLKNVQDFASKYDESVKRQVGILEEFTDKKIDLDDLQNTSDVAVLTQKVRNLGLSEKAEGRLLEVLRDRIDALFDLNETEQVLLEKVKEREQEKLDTKRNAELKELEGTQAFLDKKQEFLGEDFETAKTKLKEDLENKEITQSEFDLRMLELQNKFNEDSDVIKEEADEKRKEIDEQNKEATEERLQLEQDILREFQLESLEGTQEFFNRKQEFLDEDFETSQTKLEEALTKILESETASHEEKASAQAKFDLESLKLQDKFNKDSAKNAKKAEQNNFKARRDAENADFEARLAALDKLALTEEEHRKATEELTKNHNENIAGLNDEALQSGFDKASEFADAGFELLSSGLDIKKNKLDEAHAKENEDLQNQLESGLITQEEFDKKREELDEKQAKELHKIAVQEFNVNKAKELVGVAIDAARAVSKSIAASPLTFGLPWSAINAATGIAQALVISTQQPPPPPTFAEGGSIIQGKSHAQGGEDVHVGGRLMGNVQGGEGLFITKKQATMDALSHINQSYGGRNFTGSTHSNFFQEGGAINTTAPISIEQMTEAFTLAIADLPTPQVEVVDIQSGIDARNETIDVIRV